tara:strand:+ start:45 stop:473 length:429 start_codon:yes stop_codon:yes gene_type:complete
MASFAKINEDNQVISVLTVNDEDVLNDQDIETESVGQAYLEQHNNWPAHLWIQTSYNTINNTHKLGGTAFRGNFAGIGFTWDPENQKFWPPSPYPSWVKHNDSCSWKSPLGDPPTLTDEEVTANKKYAWNETDQSWDLVNRL